PTNTRRTCSGSAMPGPDASSIRPLAKLWLCGHVPGKGQRPAGGVLDWGHPPEDRPSLSDLFARADPLMSMTYRISYAKDEPQLTAERTRALRKGLDPLDLPSLHNQRNDPPPLAAQSVQPGRYSQGTLLPVGTREDMVAP